MAFCGEGSSSPFCFVIYKRKYSSHTCSRMCLGKYWEIWDGFNVSNTSFSFGGKKTTKITLLTLFPFKSRCLYQIGQQSLHAFVTRYKICIRVTSKGQGCQWLFCDLFLLNEAHVRLRWSWPLAWDFHLLKSERMFVQSLNKITQSTFFFNSVH